MSDMPEHVKIELPELAELDQRIASMSDQLRTLNKERQELINAEAQKIAKRQVGEEVENNRGQRFRITEIGGEYTDYREISPSMPSIIWVRYRGIQLFKKGTEGRVARLYWL